MTNNETNFDIEKLCDDALHRWQEQTQGAPKDMCWGFYSYSDASAGIGGGAGMFIWFSTKNEMMNFIATTLPYDPPGPAAADWGTVASKTKSIAEAMKDGTLDTNSGLSQLNEALKNFSQFEWMGTPEELFAGEHKYAAKVRAAFRGFCVDEDPQCNSGPILPEEKDAFCDFLDEYGI